MLDKQKQNVTTAIKADTTAARQAMMAIMSVRDHPVVEDLVNWLAWVL